MKILSMEWPMLGQGSGREWSKMIQFYELVDEHLKKSKLDP
jgi:hypothetical protein